uniref:Transmembrane protein 88 n=1 Tax=Sphenodon punctatus TaxID=8508 RepID=A0A8D0HAP6_SPHPU
GEGALELRNSLDCWACAVLVTAQNLLVGALNLLLLGLVFGTILLPAGAMLYLGFLCHPKFIRSQAPYCSAQMQNVGSTALLVAGFTLLLPLLVLALAAYCRLARRLQVGYCLVPYSKAVYKNLPVLPPHQLLLCPGHQTGEKVWV